jgi:hypothetical protein
MYALDRKGLNHLAAQGVDVRRYFRSSQEEDTAKNFLFREHMLAINLIAKRTTLRLDARSKRYTIAVSSFSLEVKCFIG